jgi:hypothetical protein
MILPERHLASAERLSTRALMPVHLAGVFRKDSTASYPGVGGTPIETMREMPADDIGYLSCEPD